MAYKPEIMSLNDFVKLNREAFTPYELWLTDELTDYLVAKRDLEKPYTSIVIDLDEDEPLYGVKENKTLVRFNGRFYIPGEDKNVKPLNMKPEQWVELLETWFKEQKIEVVIDDKATDIIKFTAIVPTLEMPEAAPEAEKTEEGADEAKPEESAEEEGELAVGDEEVPTEETPEGEEPAGEEPEGETEESTEEPAKETEEKETEEKEAPEEDAELKEFEEALGL